MAEILDYPLCTMEQQRGIRKLAADSDFVCPLVTSCPRQPRLGFASWLGWFDHLVKHHHEAASGMFPTRTATTHDEETLF